MVPLIMTNTPPYFRKGLRLLIITGPEATIQAVHWKGRALPSQERTSAQPGPSSVAGLGGPQESGHEQVRKVTLRGRRHIAPRGTRRRSPAALKGTGSVAGHFHDGGGVFVAIRPSCQWPRPSAAPVHLAVATAEGTRVRLLSPPACLPGWGRGSGKHRSPGRGRRHLGTIRV